MRVNAVRLAMAARLHTNMVCCHPPSDATAGVDPATARRMTGYFPCLPSSPAAPPTLVILRAVAGSTPAMTALIERQLRGDDFGYSNVADGSLAARSLSRSPRTN